MEVLCQRCGSVLPEAEAKFCPACGLAQLRVSEEAVVSLEPGPAEDAGAVETSHPAANGKADWRYALRCGAVVAVVGCFLQVLSSRFDAADPAVTVWVLVSSLIAIVLYHRGRPTLPMNGRMGARLGLATGLMMATLMFAAVAVSAFILRYHLHSHMMDDAMKAYFDQAATQRPLPPGMEGTWNSTEFRTGMVIGMALFSVALMTGFSAVTGALAGVVLSSSRRSAR